MFENFDAYGPRVNKKRYDNRRGARDHARDQPIDIFVSANNQRDIYLEESDDEV